MVGFSPALRFLLGNQENDRSRLPLSWSPRGELGAGVGVVGCVFVLDMVLVTYN